MSVSDEVKTAAEHHEAISEAREAANEEHEMTFLQSLHRYPRAVFWSVLLSTCIIMEGYDIVLMNSFWAQPAFSRKYGQYNVVTNSYQISATWQNALGNAVTVGAIIGAFANGWFIHRYGYRPVLLVSLLSICGFVFVSFFAPNAPVLLVGQFLCGIPWGVFATTAPAYASEVCPTVLRGYLTVYVNLCWALGQLISAGVQSAFANNDTKWAYRIPFAIQWAWPIPLFAILSLAPESPWFYVRTGDPEKAMRMVVRLSSSAQRDDAKKRVEMMVHTNERERSLEEDTSYIQCFKGIDRRRTEIACMVFAAQPLCGSAMGGTPTYFFVQAGVPQVISFKMSVGGLGIASIGTIVSWVLMSYVGRRKLYLWGLGGLTATLSIVGFISVGADRSSAGNYAEAAMMIVWLCVYYMTVGPICYAIVGEISSTRLRGKSVCLARVVYYVAKIISDVINPYMLNPTAGNWKGKTALFWSGCAFLFFIWAFFRLPETKGRTYEELDIMFAERIPARDFAKQIVDAYAEDDHADGRH
jgi:SP family general alpha glucoside:H+ symporter-like MFS transporter